MSNVEAAAGEAPETDRFPADMPRDCPPEWAELANGQVFRVVKNDPPEASDFLTWEEDGKLGPDRECECYGVSVFREMEDAASYADKFPYLGSLVAAGTLEERHGKIAPTPRIIRRIENSHTTWWPYEGVVRHVLFAVVQEED